ncbi:MAG: phenylalanine--tRNA ligase subunit alpha [Methylacidiphilales bacterium]|nr:phenylalanine--tRNA ligase subunit alpha [Candidatus Methylacidiphilales bacterium]
MIEELQQLKEQALAEIGGVQDAAALEAWRVKYLSRQGLLPAVLEKIKDVPKEQRPEAGKSSNLVKKQINDAFDLKKQSFGGVSHGQPEDTSLTGRPLPCATPHVVHQTIDRIVSIFRRMGFALADGPEMETEFYNFDALNTPADHPARNEQDTFYVDHPADPKYGRYLLRTQTSTVQIRTMENQKPPIRIIAPGRCYRRDEIDATHGVFFHQIESLVVDEGITLRDLKGAMEYFFKEFMGADTKVRFRPHFFPFTEPSFEIDMARAGSSVKGREWLEICGCGMVDPAVFQSVGIDSERYTGFAFGMGVERMAMLRHGIPDLRLFYENDIRFLKQF